MMGIWHWNVVGIEGAPGGLRRGFPTLPSTISNAYNK